MLNYGMVENLVASNNIPYNKSITEATYYGKNEQLLKAEKLLDEMIQIAAVSGTSSESFNNKMMQVAEVLRSTFGFNSLQINNTCLFVASPVLLVALTMQPGCTLCHSSIIKYTKGAMGDLNTWQVDFDKKHRGIKFKPSSKYSMRMFLGMELFLPYGDNTMTGAEILAIILHEIGHNFYVGPIHEFSAEFIGALSAPELANWMCSMIASYGLIEGSAIIDEMLPDDFRSITTRITNTIGRFTSVIGQFNNIFSILVNLFRMSIVIGVMLARLPFKMPRAFIKYDSEKYSDAFATSYGYGAELSSALDKLGHLKFVGLSDNKNAQYVLDFLYALYRTPLQMILALCDEHPNTQGRLKNDIKYMEEAGKKIIDPSLKKEFDIEMKKMYDLRDQTKAYMGPNPIKLNNKFIAIIQDLLSIPDIKDLTTSLYPKLTKYKNLDVPVGN